MVSIRVGEPVTWLNREVTPGFSNFNYEASFGYLLIMGIENPTAKEILGVQRGPLELRCLGNDLATILLYRFGDALPWGDAPFEWARLAPENRIVPPKEKVLPWYLFLVDSATQVLRAMRIIHPDEEFQHRFIDHIVTQVERKPAPTEAEAMRYLTEMQRFTPAQLAALAVSKTPVPVTSGEQMLVTFAAAMKSFRVSKTS